MSYRANYFNDEKNKSNYGWYTCIRCGKKLRKGDVDVDHILPQSYGGSNSPDNLQCMCRHCNRSKGNGTEGTYDDYKENAVRRENPNMNKLNRALNQGAAEMLKWLKK